MAKHKVIIPKEPTKGSYFGQCTCGLSKRVAVPCEHMAAIVVSSRIGVLTRNNIMPFWWKRAQWQEQFPCDVTPECFANMEVIRANYKADDTVRYCPAWSTANKPGRPAKGKRKLSALKTAQGMKRKPKHLKRFCQICKGIQSPNDRLFASGEKQRAPPPSMEGSTCAGDEQGIGRGRGRGGKEDLSRSITRWGRRLAGV